MRPKVRSARLTVAATTMLLALAGCFLHSTEEPEPVGPGGPNAPAAPDPCQLVTREEVQAVQGGVIATGRESAGNLRGERVCSFDKENSGAITTVSVYPSTQEYFDGERRDVDDNTDLEDLDGLGDQAFIGGGVLFIHKGQFTIVVVAGGPGADGGPVTEAEVRAKLLKLGQAAAGRLS